MKNITKREAKDALGIESDAELARWFGIGRAAVGLWGEDEPLPASRQWELRAKRPEIWPAEVA